MLVPIYKLQMLVGSVTAWQLGLCLVYFSATSSLDWYKGLSFFFFFLSILFYGVWSDTEVAARDHVQMIHDCRPLCFSGAHFASPAQTSRSRSPPCPATRRIRGTPQSPPWKPSSLRSHRWPSTFQITLPTWWAHFPLQQGRSGTSSSPCSCSTPIHVRCWS